MVVTTILRSERGQFLIFVTLAFIVLGLLVGLVVDGGRVYLIQARLSKLVDAAALAAAKAIVGAADPLAAAESAACDSAAVNGVDPQECGLSGSTVQVAVTDVTNPDGTVQQGVLVTAAQIMNTSFMQLGTLIGCTGCESVTVLASGSAAPGVVDISVVFDDTGSMRNNPVCDALQTIASGCRIALARQGAQDFVNSFITAASDLVKIALVPFRGCYDAGPNCVNTITDIINLTDNAATIIGARGTVLNGCPGPPNFPTECGPDTGSGILGLWAQGFSGTYICRGLEQGRLALFGTEGRPFARRFLVVLTDGDNENTPAPCPGTSSGDQDMRTLAKATEIKGLGVQIIVIGYGMSGIDDGTPCNTATAALAVPRNLAKCIASPGKYREAANAAEIAAIFLEVAELIKKGLRLVT